MDILPIVITAVSVSILWLAYLKFFKNDGSSQNQSELKDKEHEIELIKLGHEKELSVLKEKLNSIEIEKNHLEDTLTKERETTKNQLETLGKVDAFKTSVTGNMGRYSEMIEKQQKFIDKLTGNAKYQGNFGEKFLEQSLQFHGFKLNVDYTKQKHEDVYNLEDDKSETGTILQEIQPGYMLGDRLLRPALVGVAKRNNSKNNEKNEKKDKK